MGTSSTPAAEWAEGLDEVGRDGLRAQLRQIRDRLQESGPSEAVRRREVVTGLVDRREPLGELYLDMFAEHNAPNAGIVPGFKLQVAETVAVAQQENPLRFDQACAAEELATIMSQVVTEFREGLAPDSPSGKNLETFLNDPDGCEAFRQRLHETVAEQPPSPEHLRQLQQRLRKLSRPLFGNALKLEVATEVAQWNPADTFDELVIAESVRQDPAEPDTARLPHARGILLDFEQAGLIVRTDETEGRPAHRPTYRRVHHPYWEAMTETARHESERFFEEIAAAQASRA